MKKIICLILCIFVLALTGCNQSLPDDIVPSVDTETSADTEQLGDTENKGNQNSNVATYNPYECLVFDMANDGVLSESESVYWSKGYFDEENVPDKTIEFNGVKYTGKYDWSIVGRAMSFTTQIFWTDEGFCFSIRSDTQQLISFTTMNKEYFETEPRLKDVENSAQVASDLADDIIKQYLGSTDGYTLEKTVEEDEYIIDGITYTLKKYRFTYERKIKGYDSSDWITVLVTSKGHVVSFNIGDLGVFDDAEIDFDDDKLDESLFNKINEIYEKTGYTVLEMKIAHKEIGKTPDGDVCVIASVELSLQDKNGWVFGSGVKILVMI